MKMPDDDASQRASSSSKGRVLVVPFPRPRQRDDSLAKSAPSPKGGPCRAAQMLALAHEFQRLIDEGEVPDRATLAKQVGLTRARLTQILDHLLLAPEIQESVLYMHVEVGRRAPISERDLRGLVRERDWRDQRASWDGLRPQNNSA